MRLCPRLIYVLKSLSKPKDVYFSLTASWDSIQNALIDVESGRVPSALPPAFTASCGLSESRNVKSWSETQSDLIPSSLRPSSPNTRRPCAAEVSYLFFLSCWARLHAARTRGSHASQQWCIMDHRKRQERADCRTEGVTPQVHAQCPFHTSTAFF